MSKKFVRKIQRAGTHSYYINLPKGLVKLFGWKERQRLEIRFGGRKHRLVIKDFDPQKQGEEE